MHRYLVTVRTEDDVDALIEFLNGLGVEWEPEQLEEKRDDIGTYYDQSFWAYLSTDQEDELDQESFIMYFYKDGIEYGTVETE
jgi:hypothetical protein